ncbi:zinc finger CCCH domain-containing protein 7B-like [Hippoglossus hippoglossus]|uniref:zinc finger CCCH domain-containing protein 7B-like n=1 Tax=Hippoglossus hippoglossus TaxID=8267 RepID=UPI00148E064E|nr:zinc finger CCCH domain-containing protein 7B-like [Hippoglossus hippoglossus]XP_034448956.1 zinc finger CCCH domain-containing protein 7B-like [Hippoglossus hippoglossus]XP_034448957.1 zinc finger CCCH domain-containing protein 7B-like [Hippoglossus hippoglossus]XP_034448958.1 zinc finger CCCH domain-containing protein 7B-like [Hippoglossus hippoglossus]
MDPDRHNRRQEISKALTFIQSSLAYPEPEGYQDFLTQLVCNLLHEGNTWFRDGEWAEAMKEFSEGLNVSCYATGEDIPIPEALLQSLYVNRAAAYHRMGEFDRGVTDCDSALLLCKESSRALYRKALCLKGLGKYKEAYSCTTDCLLISRLDKDVNELAQELTAHLGLKNRKPYISAKEHKLVVGVANGNTTAEITKVSFGDLSDGVNPLRGLAPVCFPSMPLSTVPSMFPSFLQPVVPSMPDRVETDTVEDSELIGDDLDSLLDGFSPEQETSIQAAYSVSSRMPTSTHSVPSALPAPTPRLPPAFFNSAVSQLKALDSFSGGGHSTTSAELDTLDTLLTSQALYALDDFSGVGVAGVANSGVTSPALQTLNGLDSLDDFSDALPCAAAATEGANLSKTELDTGERSLDDLLDELDDLETVCDPVARRNDVPTFGVKAVERLDSLDVLDSFSSVEGAGAALPAVNGRTGLDSISDFSLAGVPGSHSAVAPSPKNNYIKRKSTELVSCSNPLSSTHEFLQACSACFPREGHGIYTFVHKPDLVHGCNRDILLCRRKSASPPEWTRVRSMPPFTSFKGRFVLCREVQNSESGMCKYREQCTFAYNQLEIDVWTEERKGTLDRSLLFEKGPVKLDPITSVIHLLQEHKGTFVFLCQKCFDGKPRIISNRCRDNVCSNLEVHHCFDANKCLAFVLRTHNVNYRKVRPLTGLRQLDLCYQAVRYGCEREDSCHHAHSLIELKTWRVQQKTGISPDEIVKVATKFHNNQEQNSNLQKWNKSPGSDGIKPGGGGKSLNMKIKLSCAQCWRDGLISEPDKNLKYCTAKARHIWTKDRRVLLVRSLMRQKWVQVRPMPNNKNIPLQYEMCAQILKKKICNYIGNCSFAHSEEEREIWTYMKNNDLQDIQQVYDTWMRSNGQNRQADGAAVSQSVPEEKYIAMPTDFAEPMSGFHCRLCGKHSNSERQWQTHISTEKHKERVFSCEGEDEALTWIYRFPGANFELCPKWAGGCADGVSCDFAHSAEELKEWTERRAFLRQKLVKAREDMLVMFDEFDFGMYNFLLLKD